MFPCIYCKHWSSQKIIKKGTENKEVTTRDCSVGERRITPESDGCKFFGPGETFYCFQNNHWTGYANCMQRRRNPSGLDSWNKTCSKCRQFDIGIRSIVVEYYLNRAKEAEPKVKRNRKIKRRGEKKKRAIKRRSKSDGVRKIKRRKRKIQRRNQCQKRLRK